MNLLKQTLVWTGLLVSALYSGLAHSAEIQLGANWLGTDGKLSRSEFAQVLLVASREAGTAGMIADVVAKMGFKDQSEIFDLIRICNKGPVDGENGHLATFEETRITHPTLGYTSPPDNGAIPKTERFAEQVDHDAFTENIRVAKKPEICLIPSLSVGEAAITLAHELTHLLGYVPFDSKDILEYESADAYARDVIEHPGGELDAHVAHTHLAQTLGLADPHNENGLYARYLASDGTLADREGMIQAILKDAGYGARLHDEYLRKLQSARTATAQQLAETPPRGNPVFIRNIEKLKTYESQLEAAIAQHPSNEAELKTQLDDARKQRKEQERLVDRQIAYARTQTSRLADLDAAIRRAQ